MKIYVAASFDNQAIIREEASTLWGLGHEVVSTWVHEVAKPEVMEDESFKRKLAIKDIAEVTSADLILLDNRQLSGGKNVEWGVSLGQHQKKLLWIIGKPTNVFHYLADRFLNDWDETRQALGGK